MQGHSYAFATKNGSLGFKLGLASWIHFHSFMLSFLNCQLTESKEAFQEASAGEKSGADFSVVWYGSPSFTKRPKRWVCWLVLSPGHKPGKREPQ